MFKMEGSAYAMFCFVHLILVVNWCIIIW